jgi:hypothetical protein
MTRRYHRRYHDDDYGDRLRARARADIEAAEDRYSLHRPIPRDLPDIAQWEPDPADRVESALEHLWKLTCEERP